MKSAVFYMVVLALLLGEFNSARAGSIALDATGRGWIDYDTDPSSAFFHTHFANGNTPGNFYSAGGIGLDLERNHFDFAIPVLPGTLKSATLSLDKSSPPGHVGAPTTFTVYSLGAYGTYDFNDIGAGTLYGSAAIAASGTVTITLNAAALAAITADQGGTFSLGGVDSGEANYANYDFEFTRSAASSESKLTLDTVPTPEPATLTLLGIGIIGIIGYQLRRALRWNPQREEFMADNAANRLRSRENWGEWNRV